MSLKLSQENGTNLLEVQISDKLTHEDYERFEPKVDEMVKRHGKIRVLFDMQDFHGWNPGGLWDDTKFTMKHYGDIERIAMIGDKTWEKGMSVFCKPFTSAEVRYFEKPGLSEAHQWLEQK
jgi:hypothetical protein